MKSTLTALLLLCGISLGQSVSNDVGHPCTALLQIETKIYAGKEDETIDEVTVCSDGTIRAFHSFTAPAFGATPAQPTKWEYSGHLNTSEVADLKKFVRRNDLAGLPERVDLIKRPSRVDSLMLFTFLESSHPRTITIDLPYSWCSAGKAPEIPKAALDLVCLYFDLYDRAKRTTSSPGKTCGCRPLHEMALR